MKLLKREACLGGHAFDVNCLEPCAEKASVDVTQPLLVPHDYRDIKVAENTTITIDLEDLKRQMTQDFYRQADLGIRFGA